MANSIFGPEPITDTNEHTFPPADEDPIEDKGPKTTVKIVSTLDASGTVKLIGATFDDESMDEPILDTKVGIDAGNNETVLKAIHSTINWSFVRVKFIADSAPTTGTLKIVFQGGQ